MSLDVYLHERQIGELTREAGTDYSFVYSADTVAEATEGAIVLSNSLPVREDAYDAIATRTFFDGLLPEDVRRDEIARALRVSSNDGFALLEKIGRDCAGAVVVVPAGEAIRPNDGQVSWLPAEELEELVERLPAHPLGVAREGRRMRLSLAGVQRKLTLIRSGSGQFGEPRADAPSTHLIKPQYDAEYPDLAYNEMFCMQVAKCAGLPVAETQLEEIAGRPCLISRRFDRGSDGMRTTRLHQEDLCQALGIPSNLKYQEASGPGFRQLCGLLQEIGRGADVETSVRAAVCNFMLGNGDAHGKNFAILFAELGRRLAPLYDLVSTEVYGLEGGMAMSIGDAFEPEQVTLADWADMSHDCDLRLDPFLAVVREMATRVRVCAESVAQLSRAEDWHVPVIDEILAIARRRSDRIAAQLG
jgi:serine/threonine-protein kinase HipA